MIDDRVQSKTLKPNSVSLPQAKWHLIYEKRPKKTILETAKTTALQDQLQETRQTYQTIHSTNTTKQLDEILQRYGTFRRA